MTPFGIRKRIKKLMGREEAPAKPEVKKYDVAFVLPDGGGYTTRAKHEDSLVLASGRGPQPIATGCADGTCGTCQVDVLSGAHVLSPPTAHELKTKKANNVPDERRLGCQTLVTGEGVKVRIVNVFGEEMTG